jgi:hypothetical protein
MPRNALIQLRRDTAANWTSTNPTLAAGEMGFETDTGKFKIGTGSTAWTSLLYATDASDITGTITGGSASTVQANIQVRRDTAANWTSTNPTLAAGEMGFETDTGKFKIGTGSTAWTSLAYSFNATISTSQPTGGSDGDVWMVYS